MFLAVPRAALIRAHFALDTRDLMEQPEGPAGEPFGVRDAINREAVEKIFCLADAQHPRVRTKKSKRRAVQAVRGKRIFSNRSTSIRGGGNNQSCPAALRVVKQNAPVKSGPGQSPPGGGDFFLECAGDSA